MKLGRAPTTDRIRVLFMTVLTPNQRDRQGGGQSFGTITPRRMLPHRAPPSPLSNMIMPPRGKSMFFLWNARFFALAGRSEAGVTGSHPGPLDGRQPIVGNGQARRPAGRQLLVPRGASRSDTRDEPLSPRKGGRATAPANRWRFEEFDGIGVSGFLSLHALLRWTRVRV